MRRDEWLAQRLGRPALTWEPGDDPSAIASAARAEAPAFAQARVACDDVAGVVALQDAGFRVVDVTVTVERAGPLRVGADSVQIGAPREADRAALLEIAARHYGVSRFHLDPLIGADVASAIKRDWLAAALDGTRGDGVLCATVAGTPAGFLAGLRPDPPTAVIDLVAVHPDHRRAGAGAALVGALAAESERVRAGTQAANVGALRFYARLGFAPVDTRFVLHLHA